ncbi:cytochrome P450 [Nonomuraea fuscirosea]|uniref:cytochrome P450 n=1 Tax=Nonomuraea fuscirosea TaxID=1291556 RepID=UPI00341EA635
MTSSPVRCPFQGGVPNLADPGLFRDGDPHAIWRHQRQTEPVSRQYTAEGLGFWSVSRYADVDLVLRDHEVFTSEQGTMLLLLGRGDPAGGRQMTVTDPPRHGELRDPVQRALRAKPIEARSEQMREAIVELLAPLADGGTYDLAAYMARVPMAVIGSIMALPRADWPRLAELSLATVAPADPALGWEGDAESVLNDAHRELFAYFVELVGHRHNHPGDDLVSLLLGMTRDGRPLTMGEIVSNCYGLLVGANATTGQVVLNTLADTMGTAALAEWAESPGLLFSGVEEALRWATPTLHFMRHARTDVKLGGRLIRAGDAVVVWLGSANRDEDVFTDPYTFDVRRRPNRHLTFGSGPHYCVGHSVARVALRLLFAELFTRYHDFAPAGPAVRLYSNIISGWTRMPITARVRPPAHRPLSSESQGR